MGVLQCNRAGCENIMCDRYSHEHGYICYHCFEELVEKGAATDIEEFMTTKKRKVNREAALARFKVEFPVTGE